MQLLELKHKWLSRGVAPAELNEILLNVLNCEFGDLSVDKPISRKDEAKIDRSANRFLSGEPVSKIFHKAYFYGREFYVDNKVLSPRADTENLVVEAIKIVKPSDHVLDMCTGTGAIGITVNLETGVFVTLADISRHALAVAKKNAKRLGARCELKRTNMFAHLGEKYNVICCNPPYITPTEYESLDMGVKKYDPKLALVGGADGLAFYRELAHSAHKYLLTDGALIMEIGYMQAQAVTDIFKQTGYTSVTVVKDLAGRDRVMIIKE